MKFDQRVSLQCLQNFGKVVSEKFDEFSEAKVSCSDDQKFGWRMIKNVGEEEVGVLGDKNPVPLVAKF